MSNEPNRYIVRYADIPEASHVIAQEEISRLRNKYPGLIGEIERLIDYNLSRNPNAYGVICFANPLKNMRVYLTPARFGLPSLRVLYEVSETEVVIWRIQEDFG